MTSQATASTTLERLGPVIVTGDYFYSRGSRDSYGMPLEPDEDGFEITSVIHAESNKELMEELTEEEFQKCLDSFNNGSIMWDDAEDYPDPEDYREPDYDDRE